MKMLRKLLIAGILILLSAIVSSCVGGPKRINFSVLNTKTFTLTYVSYMTNMENYNREIPVVFESFPIRQVIGEIEEKYGVIIGMGLFESGINASNIQSYNLSMPNYFIDADPNDQNHQQVSINFRRMYQEDALKASISLRIFENGKVVGESGTEITISNWKPY
jgi:hypothetical protein